MFLQQTTLLLGAIDIGSNAGRLMIGEVTNGGSKASIKKITLVRIPLRLGEDVFTDKRISKKRLKMLIKTMKAYKLLLDVYNVEEYRACATSALREAENRDEIIQTVFKESGIKLELIPGDEEADLILSNFFTQNLDQKKSYLYIDVGGGSTEVSLIENGQKISGKSFKMGTLRILKDKVPDKRWLEMKEWVTNLNPNHHKILAVGTGGNINRILKMGNTNKNIITYDEIKKTQGYIASFTYEDRIKKLGLRPDRADVIVPAADIYLAVMRYAGVEEMMVPKIGLSDGILFDLYKKSKKSSGKSSKK